MKSVSKDQDWVTFGLRQGLLPPGQAARQAATALPDARELEKLLAREAVADPEDLYRLGLAYESDAFWAPDYKKAFSYFERSEALGYPYAKAQLGYYYETGLAGVQDHAKAVALYQEGADFGDYWAGLRLGYMYMDGHGVRRHEGQAYFWINWARQAGVRESIAALGWLHEFGIGTPVDMKEAARLYREAGEEGLPSGWVLLGLLHENGDLGTRDFDQAVAFYRKAAEAGHGEGKHHLGTMYYMGRGVEKDRERAVSLFREAADLGYVRAHVSLGLAFEQGGGVAQSYADAAEQYRSAIEKDRIPRALAYLAWLHAEGEGVDRDLGKARRLYEEAVAEGDNFALTELGLAFVNGDPMTGLDVNKGRRLLLEAADSGRVAAILSLADMYERGVGVAEDTAAAIGWYRKAADLGSAEALSELGDFYENGRGVEQDFEKAFELYRQALDQGFQGALVDLGVLHANDAWSGRDHDKALEYLEQAHGAQVDVAAMVLGTSYFEGDWLEEDLARARRYFQEAAENGYWLASAYLGFLEEEGYGGPRDIESALRHYETAAEGDSLYAARRLAALYAEGGTVTPDEGKALQWRIRAGTLGDADLAYEAAETLYNDPLHKDVERAVALYRIAARNGNLDASVKWARAQILGETKEATFQNGLEELQYIVEQNPLTSLGAISQLISDKDDGLNQMRKQREKDLFLGIAYAHGIVLPRDLGKAEHHLRRASDQSSSVFPAAQFALSKFLFENAPDLPEVNREIVDRVTLAAKAGYTNAQISLAQAYIPMAFSNRNFGLKDPAAASKWFELAARHNDKARMMLAVAAVEGWAANPSREKGIDMLEDLAEAGFSEAAFQLGRHHAEGKVLPMDPARALFWFEKAARFGNAAAFNGIGLLHQREMLPDSSQETAFEHFMQAAERGHASAAGSAAWHVKYGVGTEKDPRAAEELYLTSLERGDEWARVNLAILYFEEMEIFGEAKAREAIATLKGYEGPGQSHADLALGRAYLSGRAVERDPKKAEILLLKARAGQPRQANADLGDLYFWGKSGKVDYARALEHYLVAGELGSAPSLNGAGWIYENGLDVEADPELAADFYARAIDAGSDMTLSALGLLYRDGRGVAQDHVKAVELFQKGEELGLLGGTANLGWMKLYGLGTPQDRQEGLALIEKSAEGEDHDGAYYLALLLEEGEIVEADPERAVALYKIAAKQGNFLAQDALTRLGETWDVPWQ